MRTLQESIMDDDQELDKTTRTSSCITSIENLMKDPKTDELFLQNKVDDSRLSAFRELGILTPGAELYFANMSGTKVCSILQNNHTNMTYIMIQYLPDHQSMTFRLCNDFVPVSIKSNVNKLGRLLEKLGYQKIRRYSKMYDYYKVI